MFDGCTSILDSWEPVHKGLAAFLTISAKFIKVKLAELSKENLSESKFF